MIHTNKDIVTRESRKDQSSHSRMATTFKEMQIRAITSIILMDRWDSKSRLITLRTRTLPRRTKTRSLKINLRKAWISKTNSSKVTEDRWTLSKITTTIRRSIIRTILSFHSQTIILRHRASLTTKDMDRSKNRTTEQSLRIITTRMSN